MSHCFVSRIILFRAGVVSTDKQHQVIEFGNNSSTTSRANRWTARTRVGDTKSQDLAIDDEGLEVVLSSHKPLLPPPLGMHFGSPVRNFPAVDFARQVYVGHVRAVFFAVSG
jgi:hypothetical protein